MPGVWQADDERDNKYLVQRRDGTVPEWPWFVLGAKDPAAPFALRAYAAECASRGMDRQYWRDVYALADRFEEYARSHGVGDPDGAKHRTDDPEVVALLDSKPGEPM